MLRLVEHELSQIARSAEGRYKNLLELCFCDRSSANVTVCALLTDLTDEVSLVRLTLLQVDAYLSCRILLIVIEHFKALVDAYV